MLSVFSLTKTNTSSALRNNQKEKRQPEPPAQKWVFPKAKKPNGVSGSLGSPPKRPARSRHSHEPCFRARLHLQSDNAQAALEQRTAAAQLRNSRRVPGSKREAGVRSLPWKSAEPWGPGSHRLAISVPQPALTQPKQLSYGEEGTWLAHSYETRTFVLGNNTNATKNITLRDSCKTVS